MAWVCPNGCDVDEVIASVPEDMDPDGIGILVDAKTGEATNRWGDGTVGVPDDIAEMAEADESPVCPECFEYCEWVHNDKDA